MNTKEPFLPATSATLLRAFTALGACNAFLAVALGAFGAHALKATLEANGNTTIYQTGAQYHLTHALALLLIALLAERLQAKTLLRTVGLLFAIGIFFFSGSLYLLAISNIKFMGAITPIGGVCFLSGWALLVVAVLREKRG